MQFKRQKINPSVSTTITSGLAGGFLLCSIFVSCIVQAKDILVTPGHGVLQAAVEAARSGDRLILASGTYTGSVNINRSLSLLGEGSSIIDGEGTGHVITISASDVVVRGLKIQHSGNVLENENSGIFITKQGDRAHIESNHLENNLIGIYLKGSKSVFVGNNVIVGSQFHRMNDRGNGIYLWDTPGSIIVNNDIRYGRDGIFVNVSKNNIFRGNRMRDLRFAIHYMYTNNSEISNK